MKLLIKSAIVACGVFLFSLETASAQAPYARPSTRAYQPPPAFSPYLNLARGGNAAINYYGIVRPELQINSSINQLQQDINLTQPTAEVMLTTIPDTGHPTQFMNFSHYYGNQIVRPATMRPSNTPLATQSPIIGFGVAPTRRR